AREALAVDESPAVLYQVAGIYALTSRDHPDDSRRACQLLAAALRQGYGYDLLKSDRDLDRIRDDPQFGQLLEAARTVQPRRRPPPPSEGRRARPGPEGAG